MNSVEIKNKIIELLKAKKASDITVVDLGEQTIIADYFVIATGKSTTQVRALTDHLEEKGEECGLTLLRRDGEREARWVVMDYGGVIVHIFNDAMRDFYALEKLWAKDNNIIKIED